MSALGQVTISMIADYLGMDEIPEGADESWPSFAGIIDTQVIEKCCVNGVPTSELLVCGPPDSCLRLLEDHVKLHAICLCDEASSAEYLCLRDTGRCALVSLALSREQLLGSLSCLFLDIANWRIKLQELLLEGASLNDLLDASLPLLKCPVVISGVGLEIVAYTHEAMPQDTMICKAIDQGFFDEEQVKYFHESGMPALWNSIRDFTVLDNVTEHRSYPIVFYIFRIHDNYYLHMTTHCSERKPTAGLIDMLRILAFAIERFIELNPPSRQVFGTGFPALLAKVTQGKVVITPHVRAQFAQSGVTDETKYRLHLVDYGFEEHEEQLAMQAALDLFMRFPEALVGIAGSNAIVLEVEPCTNGAFSDLLAKHAKSKSATLVASDAFIGIEHMTQAYRQLQATKRVMRQYCSHREGELSYTQAFGEYFTLFEDRDSELIVDCLQNSIPAHIRKRDILEQSSDLEILETFLTCERRASIAAEKLFMHRNTLSYRVGRIEDEYGISLEDLDTRRRLEIEISFVKHDKDRQ